MYYICTQYNGGTYFIHRPSISEGKSGPSSPLEELLEVSCLMKKNGGGFHDVDIG